MSDEEVVYSYTAESDGIMESLAAISEGIQGLIEDINALVDASSGLGEFEGIFEEIASIFGEVDAAAGGVTESLAGVAEEAGAAGDALSSVGASGGDLAEIGAGADEAGAAMAALSEEAGAATDALSGIGDAATSLGEVDAAAQSANEYLASLGEQAFTTGEGFDGMASTAASAMAEIAGSADAAAGGVDGLQSVIDSLGGTIAEDTSIIDGLNEAVANLEAQLMALTDAEASAEEGGSGLGNVFSGLQNAFNGMMEGLGGVGEGIQGFMGGVGDALGGIGDFANSVFMGAMKFQMFGQMAMQAGQALLGPAEQAETMKTAFTTLMGSTQKATDEMAKLDAFASKTPFQTMDIDHAASQLIGFGINVNDVIPDLTAMGDALSAVGRGSSANLNQIVNIFGKIQLGGKLTVGEMQQFSHDGVNAWAVLEQQTGKTQAQLQKMITAGLFPANVAIKDLTQGIEKNPLYAGGMAKQSMTMTGLLSTLKSNWDQMLSSFASPILQDLEPMVGKLGDTLASPGFKQFATGVGKGISDTFKDIGTWVKSLDLSKISGDFQYLGQQLGIVAPNGTQVKNAFSAIGGVLKTVVTDTGNFARGLGDVVKWFKDGGTPAQVVKDALVGIGVAIAAIGIGAFVLAIPALVGGFIAWSIAAGAAAIATLAATWPIIAIGAGIALVVTGIILAVQHWGQISAWLQGVWASFSSWFMGALGDIGAFFGKVWDGIKTGLQTAWGFIVNAVKIGALALLAVVFAPIIGIAALFIWLYNHNTYFKKLVDAIVNFFKGCFTWLQGAWQDTINWLVGAWNDTIKFASDLWGKVSGAVHDGFFAAIGFISDIWDTISSFFVNAWTTYISKPLTTLWTNVSTFFGNAWTNYVSRPIGDLWTNLSTTVGGWATNALSWGENLIQSFIDGIKNKAAAVGTALADTAKKIASFLGFHSPTEEGPGRYADQWAPALMDMFIGGIEERQAKLKQVVESTGHILSDGLNKQISMQINTMATAQAMTSNLPQGPNAGATMGNEQMMQYLARMSQSLQGIERQTLSAPSNANLGAMTQQYNNMSFSGINDPQSLMQMLEKMMGQNFIYGQRGANFNY